MAEVRKATAADLPLLLPLVERYWAFESISGFDSEVVSVQLARLLQTPALGAGWMALTEGAAAGYLLAVYVFSLEHGGLTAEIDEFFVVPDQRCNGIGLALLTAAEAEFVRCGCTSVSLQLGCSNEVARGFYRRQGYSERSGFELLDKMLPSVD